MNLPWRSWRVFYPEVANPGSWNCRRSRRLFHVKRRAPECGSREKPRPRKAILFPNTELTEDHVQDILDVDPAQQSPQRMNRCSELLGRQLLAVADNVDA